MPPDPSPRATTPGPRVCLSAAPCRSCVRSKVGFGVKGRRSTHPKFTGGTKGPMPRPLGPPPAPPWAPSRIISPPRDLGPRGPACPPGPSRGPPRPTCDEVGVGRRRGRGGDGAVAVRAAREVALAGLQVVGGRPLLQQGLVVHGGRRPPRPARLRSDSRSGSGSDSRGRPDGAEAGPAPRGRRRDWPLSRAAGGFPLRASPRSSHKTRVTWRGSRRGCGAGRDQTAS